MPYMLLLLRQLISFSATLSVMTVGMARGVVRQLRAALDGELYLVPCTWRKTVVLMGHLT